MEGYSGIMKNNVCILCGWPGVDRVIDGVMVCLCSLHNAEYNYKPDGFFLRHGLEKKQDVEL